MAGNLSNLYCFGYRPILLRTVKTLLYLSVPSYSESAVSGLRNNGFRVCGLTSHGNLRKHSFAPCGRSMIKNRFV